MHHRAKLRNDGLKGFFTPRLFLEAAVGLKKFHQLSMYDKHEIHLRARFSDRWKPLNEIEELYSILESPLLPSMLSSQPLQVEKHDVSHHDTICPTQWPSSFISLYLQRKKSNDCDLLLA